MIEERKDFVGKALWSEFGLGNEFTGVGFDHGVSVAKLVAVGGTAEWNEDGSAAGGGNFRGSDGSGAADDEIGPGKALGHVRKERENFCRVKFAAGVSGSNGVVVAFTGLMHDA